MRHFSDVIGLKCVVLFFTSVMEYTRGHGRLVDPPSRASMFRYGFDNPPNYNDNQLFCGGVQVQYAVNGGKCGVCGDPWQGPLEHEPGGKYANGIIVRKYDPGTTITVKVQLTASHKGYFEFRLCPSNNPFKRVSHKCLDKFVLKLADSGKTRYYVPNNGQHQLLQINLRLPKVKCRACVLQWKYNAGNSWGVDPVSGEGCIGCGNQEQFYGCADIAIGAPEVEIGQKPDKHPWYFDTDDSWYWGTVEEDYEYDEFSSRGSVVVYKSLQWTIFAFIIFLIML